MKPLLFAAAPSTARTRARQRWFMERAFADR
jgi:hypothetical protein